jgi:dTDP-4-amino-4,6-dideoxygalactose transaminase
LLSLLEGLTDLVLPVERPGEEWSYHMFPVLSASEEERDALRAALLQQGVDTSRNYFNIVELSRAFGYLDGCPVSESVARRMLTLPSYASLSTQDVERISDSFTAALRTYRSRRGMQVSPVSRVSSPGPRTNMHGTESVEASARGGSLA